MASGWLEPVSSAAARRSTSRFGTAEADDIRDLGLALGERAGLVERHRGDLAERLQHRAALDQQPAPGAGREAAAIAAGVEMTSAQGQPISRMARPL